MKPQKGPKKFKFNLGHVMYLTVIVCTIAMLCANFNAAAQREKVRIICESGSFLDGVSDQYPWLEIIPVESIGEVRVIENSTSSQSAPLPESEKININTTSSEELQKLSGIGETKAAAIIQYRTENGGFKSTEEICRVKGIGDATFNKIRDKITI